MHMATTSIFRRPFSTLDRTTLANALDAQVHMVEYFTRLRGRHRPPAALALRGDPHSTEPLVDIAGAVAVTRLESVLRLPYSHFLALKAGGRFISTLPARRARHSPRTALESQTLSKQRHSRPRPTRPNSLHTVPRASFAPKLSAIPLQARPLYPPTSPERCGRHGTQRHSPNTSNRMNHLD